MKPFARMILVTTLALAAGCVSVPKVDNAPVAALDLSRYLGEWYEIARFDHSFERGVEQAKANYTQNADGTIKVVNSGIKDGKLKTAIGKGKKTDTPGLLRVSFFGPFYADYRIMMIDEDYTYALVGSGGADYLWILSRTPSLDGDAKVAILDEIHRRGYDAKKLIWVKQDEIIKCPEIHSEGYANQCDFAGVESCLDKVWDSISSTSESSRPISVLNLDRQMICEIEGFAPSGSTLSRIYRLAGAYIFEVRQKDGGTCYSYVKRGDNKCKALRHLEVAANQYLNINITASRLRFAPISRLGEDFFNEIWDSKQDAIVSVPSGFVGKVQCGGGVFLLERESDGGLYVWIPDSPSAPKEWKYKWLWNGSSSSFFVAENAESGVRYAFVSGLTLVPNSEGAEAITCSCISNGKQRYEILTADGRKVVYVLKLSHVGHSLKE